MKNKLLKYLKVGFKLLLVLLLGGLLLLIPRIISMFLFNITLQLVLTIILSIIGLIIDGWLIIKYKNWIFK